jgi:CDP-glucose 4,6-dehydratase
VRALIEDRPLILRNPDAVRPWQYVLEPLAGYQALAKALLDGAEDSEDAFNFGPGPDSDRTVREVVERAHAAWPAPHRGWIDASRADAPREARLLSLSADRAKARLGWRPRLSFDRAIKETMTWYHDSLGAAPADLRDRSLGALSRFEAVNA